MNIQFINLLKSKNPDKKYDVKLFNQDSGKIKTISFGKSGMSDYTKSKDDVRKSLYIARHKKREDWGKSGILTAGFWAKNLLWNKPTIQESLKDTLRKYNL